MHPSGRNASSTLSFRDGSYLHSPSGGYKAQHLHHVAEQVHQHIFTCSATKSQESNVQAL